LLSNGDIVHIARKCDLTALLAAADSGHVDFSENSLKSSPVWLLQLKMFKIFKSSRCKSHEAVDRELLKTGACVKILNKHG